MYLTKHFFLICKKMQRLFSFAKKTMPKISKTENIALQSGTTSVEKYIFSGISSHEHFTKYKPHILSPTDTEMIKKAPKILSTVREYDILKNRTTPIEHPFWDAAKTNGFFSLIVPDEYGGKKMSATGLSTLLQSLASVSASVPVHVMVPNSLGPSELLAHYGTSAQKDYFLPKLAKGSIPCFGLTSLYAGSDAAGSMTDTGTVFMEDNQIKFRLDCEKRYITLAPVADIIGIAFKIIDKNNLLEDICGRPVDGEITLALVERGHDGLHIGNYLDPLGVGFANGTVVAKDMIIDIDDVIGGVSGVGEGWKFLMEALAAGRGIALPAGAAGSSKMLTNSVSAYCTVRQQFKLPIYKFEGIQEKLADMALKTYEIDSLVSFMNSVLDNNEKPPILSAILKQRTTELGRDIVNHAMDICAGAAICMGDQNFVAPVYLSTPIGITVEGSNTMTRSLLIFGQGIVRSHPHMLSLINSIQDDNEKQFSNIVKSMIKDNIVLTISPTLFMEPLDRFARFFAMSSNMSLILGGELKRREYLSGRYADMLSYILAGYTMQWKADNTDLGNSIILKAATKRNLSRLYACAQDLIDNHPHSYLHHFMYRRVVGWNQFKDVDDIQKTQLALELCTHNSSLRSLFEKGTFMNRHPNIKRMEDFMSGKDTSKETIEKILSVDDYVISFGSLADTKKHDL